MVEKFVFSRRKGEDILSYVKTDNAEKANFTNV